MKKMILMVLLSLGAQQTFAATLNCKSTKASSIQGVTVTLTTDAFSSEDYSGPAALKIQGMPQDVEFMNVDTSDAAYVKLENNNENPMIFASLTGKGHALLVFQDAQGNTASLQWMTVDDEYIVLAEVACK